jgi:hypothetical protein
VDALKDVLRLGDEKESPARGLIPSLAPIRRNPDLPKIPLKIPIFGVMGAASVTERLKILSQGAEGKPERAVEGDILCVGSLLV